jgi:superfamily II DNA or RNA helicase
LIIGETISNATSNGYLCGVDYFAPSTFDLSRVKSNKSDYNQKSLSEFVDIKRYHGDIVDNWFNLAENESTVVFCIDIRHSIHICDEFMARGIKAEHIDCSTSDKDRRDILGRVCSGETKVLCNVYIASYGLDIPRLAVAVLARPTKSIVNYLQTIGRILRIFEGKKRGKVIDHTGVVETFGFVDSEIAWSLDGRDVRQDTLRKKRDNKEPKEINCSNCNKIYKSMPACPDCGHMIETSGRMVHFHPSNLERVGSVKKNNYDEVEVYEALLYTAAYRGFKSGWAYYRFKDAFSKEPPAGCMPKPPSGYVKSYIKHLDIKNAKRKLKQLNNLK